MDVPASASLAWQPWLHLVACRQHSHCNYQTLAHNLGLACIHCTMQALAADLRIIMRGLETKDFAACR